MARSVFFSFHYQRDIWRANIVRNSHIVEGVAAAGFRDASLWEETKKKGDYAIKQMIDNALIGTSVTVVLIGAETWRREYVNYEIERSLERGNGLLGININNIKDQNGYVSYRGIIPRLLFDLNIPCYDWNYYNFGNLVEQAYLQAANQKANYNAYKIRQLLYPLRQNLLSSSLSSPNSTRISSFLGKNLNSAKSIHRWFVLPPSFYDDN